MPTPTADRAPFPAWLRELCYYGGLIVMLTIFLLSMKSDQRSSNEEFARFSKDTNGKLEQLSMDVSAIRQMLPNKEADQLRYKMLEEKVDKNKSDLDFEIAKLAKFKEDVTKDMIRKGIM